MKKENVQSSKRHTKFGLLITLALTLGIGVALAPKESLKTKAAPNTAVYTISSTTAVETSGVVPTGSSATYSQTFTTMGQITSGKTATLTLLGYEEHKVTSVILTMKSNSSKGAGALNIDAGNNTLLSFENSEFSSNNWNGSYSDKYVNITKNLTEYEIKNKENFVIKITGSTNSLYIEKYAIVYESVENSGGNPDPINPEPEAIYYTETFDNASIESSTTYGDGSHIGINNQFWEYGDTRLDETITGKAVTVRNNDLKTTFTNGLKSLEFDYKKFYTGTGSFSVKINGIEVEKKTGLAQHATGKVTIKDINLADTVELIISTTERVGFDNIKWAEYSPLPIGPYIKINESEKSLTIGETAQLSATTSNIEGEVILNWQSSDEAVAIVTQNGLVEALKHGSANISVSFEYEDETYSSLPLTISVLLPTVSIKGGNQSLAIGNTLNLEMTITNADSEEALLEWSSSTPAVASVNKNTGVVTALSAGTTNITVSMVYAGETYVSSSIQVIVYIPVTSVTLSEDTLNLIAGGAAGTLTTTFLPANATDKTGTWSSSDESVATVSDGVVTPLKKGTTTIKFTTTDGGKYASATVTVQYAPVQSLTLNKESLELSIGRTETLVATINSPLSSQETTWSSSNEAVASVTNGVITGLELGTTIITAKSVQDSSKFATASVTVIPAPKQLFLGFNATVADSNVTTSKLNSQYKTGSDSSLFNFLSSSTVFIESSNLDALRIGTGSAAGSLKIEMHNGFLVEGVTITAKRWTTDAAKLLVTDSVEKSYSLTNTNEHLDFVFTLKKPTQIFTISSEKRLFIQKISVNYIDPAQDFNDWVMTPEDIDDVTDDCYANYTGALERWNALNPDAKTYFNTSAQFASARARLYNWAKANNGNFPGLITDTPGQEFGYKYSSKFSLQATLIIGVISLTTLAGYYFLQKKQEN